MADQARGVVAAVHAGWRGTAARVAVAPSMRSAVNSARVTDLIVAIGPSIGACCYEVGTDLVDALPRPGTSAISSTGGSCRRLRPAARKSGLRSPSTFARANTDQLISRACPRIRSTHPDSAPRCTSTCSRRIARRRRRLGGSRESFAPPRKVGRSLITHRLSPSREMVG